MRLTAIGRILFSAFLALSSLTVLPAHAAPANANNAIPEPLRPWTGWVLRDDEDRVCPKIDGGNGTPVCVWPAALDLGLDKHGGNFSQRIALYREMHADLPGDGDHWPQDVKVDGKPATVTAAEDGMPSVLLPAGSHLVSGSFAWDDMPESLQVPGDTALVSLRLNGEAVAMPHLDNGGHLWLQARTGGEDGADALELHVSRLVDDGAPLVVTTQLSLGVAGKNREMVFPSALLPDFTPLDLKSDLPAHLDAEGRLHVQLRPGQWNISVLARRMKPQQALTLPAAAAGATALAEQEAWVFRGHNDLRVVVPSGGTPVDPKLVALPAEWQGLPAFQLKPGDTLQLAESKRGDPEAAPDQLNLTRTIWLDFDGAGYSVRDQMTGNFHRNWRIDMQNPVDLGHVNINGTDQFITRDGKVSGVEVRDGLANIHAESRINSDTRTLSAVGWNEDVNSLHMGLQLPAGWRLLGATGVDHVSGSWSGLWSLLDFFVVLVIAFAFGRLWGWRWGVVAVLAFVIGYHELNAPRWTWIAALAGAALVQVLPQGTRLQRFAGMYRALAILVLVLVSLPFALTQIRQAIYPSLDRPEQFDSAYAARFSGTSDAAPGIMAPEAENRDQSDMAPAPAAAAPAPAPEEPAPPKVAAPPPMIAPPAEARVVEDKVVPPPPPSPSPDPASIASPSMLPMLKRTRERADNDLQRPDPNAIVQTGAGLPSWQAGQYGLEWSGPVDHTQELHLWLLSPAMGSLLDVLRVLLFALLIARLTGLPLRWPPTRGKAALLIMCAGAAWFSLAPGEARAQGMPDAQMLQDLKQQLQKPAPCLPQCADIARMQLDAHGGALQLRLEAHALRDVAIPLPGAGTRWQLQAVTIDGKPAFGLARDSNGQISVALDAGLHQVVMQGVLGHSENLQLTLPLKPHRVDTRVEGWSVIGVHENGLADDNLQLTRIASAETKARQDNVLPSFVTVQRTLVLGTQWRVHTLVQRVVPQEGPIVVAVPLLPGESIAATQPHVDKGVAQVSLGAQAPSIEWDSTLAQVPELALKAASQDDMIESWTLDAGTMWHVDVSGIAPVHREDGQGHWAPQWSPWPGEEVHLKVSKPQGAPGQSETLTLTQYHLQPGMRSSDATLNLVMRSSRAGLHSITLPEGALLQDVTRAINGGADQPLNLHLDGRKLALPLEPGQQQFKVVWRQPGGISTWFSAPALDLGMNGTNAQLLFDLPQDRWTLAVGGPRMGPVILIWGIIVTMALVAWALARFGLVPLRWHHWFLLGIGLTQIPSTDAALVVLWLLALGWRKRDGEKLGGAWFNLGQFVLAAWTIVALCMLVHAVQTSLLGTPEMQVAGNGSYSNHYQWYQDRYGPATPQAWVLSLPLLVYRGLMLLWALWLAWSLLKWLRWGWESFTTGGYWRKLERKKRVVAQPAPPATKPASNSPPEPPTSP